MSASCIYVEHIRLSTAKPYGDVIAAIDGQLGHFEPDVYTDLEKGGDPTAVRGRLEGMAGPSGFMVFKTSNHGCSCKSSGSRGRQCSTCWATRSLLSR